MEEQYITGDEVAKILKVHPQTVRRWRTINKGPKYYKREGIIRYKTTELQAYMEGSQ